jgi:hypothetical protein
MRTTPPLRCTIVGTVIASTVPRIRGRVAAPHVLFDVLLDVAQAVSGDAPAPKVLWPEPLVTPTAKRCAAYRHPRRGFLLS